MNIISIDIYTGKACKTKINNEANKFYQIQSNLFLEVSNCGHIKCLNLNMDV